LTPPPRWQSFANLPDDGHELIRPTRNRTSAIVPRFSPEQAQDLAARHYDLRVTAHELPSYIDQNFHLLDAAGAEYVLKISNTTEDQDFLDAQVSALEFLQAKPGRLETPRAVPSSAGEYVGREGAHALWLVTFLQGMPLAEVSELPEGLHRDLGRGLGDLDRRLAGFDHPAARRIYHWDLRNAPGVVPFTDHISDATGRKTVRSSLGRFETWVLPAVDRLPFQIIHNDANDYNILTSEDRAVVRIIGLLDFGDMVWTARACEPAIAMMYPMMTADDPLVAAAEVLAGYHESQALERAEIRLIPHLIEARLCVSVTMSSYQRRLDPDNAYLSVSEAPAWRLLDWMSTTPPARWVETFEDACASVRPIEGNASPERAMDEA
jgi:Ser/Thr protein kinase RdoA (MazF antagonist)